MTDEIERKIEQCEGQAEDASRCGQDEVQARRCGWVDALSWALRGPVKQLTAMAQTETAEVTRLQKRVDSLKTSILGLQELLNASEAQVTRAEEHFTKSQALLEGMTTEAKSRAERAEQLEDENTTLRLRVASRNLVLAHAHAHHMFGVWVDGPPADRVGALCYLRNHGLPEATPADLDTACEGLVTPWGSGPVPQDLPREPCEHDGEGSPPADVCWLCDGF